VNVDPAGAPDLAGLSRARAQEEAVRQWRIRLAPIVLVALVVITFRLSPHPGTAGRPLAVSIALGGLALGLVGLRATMQRADRWSLPPTVAVIASSAVLMWAQPNGVGAAAALIGFLCLSRLLPGRAGIGLATAGFVVLAAISVATGKGPGFWLLALLAALWGMIFLAQRLAAANEQAERLLIELQASRAAETRAAGLAERQRLAREMHDVLAHSLSGLMLQLEGARMLAADRPDDPRLPQTIDRAHHLAKTGLDEARRAIGMLRDDDLPGPERLGDLAAQFETDRGVPCSLTVDGAAHPLDSQARLALYRVAQEALTNITKHAQPERVELHLAYQPDAVRLTVQDFSNTTTGKGDHPVPAPDGSGYGLTGMRERAELLGGTLTTEATDNGFRVKLDVPV